MNQIKCLLEVSVGLQMNNCGFGLLWSLVSQYVKSEMPLKDESEHLAWYAK